MNYRLLVPMLAGRGGCPPGYGNNECVGGEGKILVTIELCLMVCTQLWLRLYLVVGNQLLTPRLISHDLAAVLLP
jgi:hypothetical protein